MLRQITTKVINTKPFSWFNR